MEELFFTTEYRWNKRKRRRTRTRRIILLAILLSLGALILALRAESAQLPPDEAGDPNRWDWVEEDLCSLEDVLCPTEIKRVFYATVYGYSPTSDQTDSSPEITALGTKVRKGIIANNCLSFGSKMMVNGSIFVIEDRMNSRYDCDVFDIWFKSREEAIKWGKKRVLIKLLK